MSRSLPAFVQERQPAWDELAALVDAAKGRAARLGPDGVRRLGQLYRQAVADLAYARRAHRSEAVTAHLDWAADSHKAELAAHEAAGAEVQGRFEGWTVLRDPAGMAYCVTRRSPGDRPE